MWRIAFEHADVDMERCLIVDPALFRDAEADLFLAHPARARAKLGGAATATLQHMIREMADADVQRLDQRP